MNTSYNFLIGGLLFLTILSIVQFADGQNAIQNIASATTNPCTITASSQTISVGESSTLSWTSPLGGTRYWLYGIYPDRNGRAVAETGSINVSPAQTTTYTFRYDINGVINTCSLRITVNATPPSTTVCTININPSTSYGLTPSTITWSSPNGSTGHRLYGISGDTNGRLVQPSGSESTIIPTTKTFTLRYTLNGAVTTCNAIATVPIFYSPPPEVASKDEIVLGLFGQSFSEALFANPARSTFVNELNRAGYPVTILFHGSGGSSALKENAPVPDRYWWDLDAQKPGPQLIAAIEKIKDSPKKPTKIMWLQGEGDSVASANPDRYYRATAQILWALKKAINPTNPTSIESYMHIIGRRITSAPDLPGVQTIREQQLLLLNTSSLKFLVDTWDLPLLGDDPVNHRGDSHMTPEGNSLLGWRAAQTILSSLAYPANQAPYLHGVKNIDGRILRLYFRTRSDTAHNILTNPLTPSHIVVKTGTNMYTSQQLTFKWLNNTTLDIGLPEKSSETATVLYPYGTISNIDRENIIKDGYGTPVQSFVITRAAP